MSQKWIVLVLFGALMGWISSPAQARGRQPDQEEGADNFPDYNRLEMRPKPKAAPAPPPVADQPVPPAPAPPPALNTPVNPSVDDDKPLPPPKAVPLPDGASEPPLPEDIKDTLIQGATDQK